MYQQTVWNRIKRKTRIWWCTKLDNPTVLWHLPLFYDRTEFLELPTDYQFEIRTSERGIFESWQVRYVSRTIFHDYILLCDNRSGFVQCFYKLFDAVECIFRLSRNAFSRESTSWEKSTRLRSGPNLDLNLKSFIYFVKRWMGCSIT